MCTRYVSPQARDIEGLWHVGRHNPWRGEQKEVFPGYQAPFIRAARHVTEPERELVIGQWNLIPWFAKAPKPLEPERADPGDDAAHEPGAA